MAWLGKVTLGNLSNLAASDIAAKLSESVKSIERNFDSALGFEGEGVVSDSSTRSFLGVIASPPQDADRAAQEADQEQVQAQDQLPEAAGSRQEPEDLKPSIQHPPLDNVDASPATPAAPDGDDTALQEEQPEAQILPPTPVIEPASFSSEDTTAPDELNQAGQLRLELNMMEKALQGAAKQAQLKADEIARLLAENDQLKSSLEEAKRKPGEVELDALREEYQHRLGAAERKVYALTKERDMLRREQSRKADSSVLLKEKDEIIKQVMAEGEELSKKQAAQESQIRKLRAQVRELEEEKQRLQSRLQVEEAKVESVKKDKAATEKMLQETIEKGHADLAAQREFYTKIVNEAREAEERAEARANSQAKADLDHRLHEAAERETALVQALEELRQGISRTEQQAAFREDVLRKDIEDLEKRCQAAEARYEELVARVPESTRPLLRQIEAMQEASAMRAEAWSGVERALNSRLQEAETKAAAAQERERGMNERLSQALSRTAVMEAQVSCLKGELAQVTRSLEKERQRASETRQEYLAALEAAATLEGRAKQLEQELQELREKQTRVLGEERSRRLKLEQELEAERSSRAELEKRLSAGEAESSSSSHSVADDGGGYSRRLPRSMSAEVESANDRLFKLGDPLSSHLGKGMLEQYGAVLRHKEGEMSSYTARLSELEATRNSLAEELVQCTTECEKLRGEVSSLAGLRAELEALRRRHASALELMGERDEQVEELRADLADVKQMYREQVDMLVGQIEGLRR